MSSEERNKWEEVAKKDKERYKVEMAIYSGPSTLPKLGGKRYKKDKSAPKRPMSAYLDYSKTHQGQVIRDYPHVIDNREISRILGAMWRNATEEEKAPFVIQTLTQSKIFMVFIEIFNVWHHKLTCIRMI